MEIKENHKIIIFDFFGVICSEIGAAWINEHLPNADIQEFRDKYFRPADMGEITLETLYRNLGELIGASSEQVASDWSSRININTQVTSLINSLKPRFTIVLASNAPTELIRPILNEHNLNELFDTIIISSEICLVKPDSIFFEKALGTLNAEPADIIFIDDNSKNVEAAEKLGIQSVVFKNIENLDFFNL